MLQPAGEVHGGSRTGGEALEPALERHLALEHEVRLVLAGVDMQGRLGAGPDEDVGE